MELDPAGLKERLRRRSPPVPPVYGDEEAGREGALTPASVLVPVVAHPGRLTVLFTQRTSQLRIHSGQISFPGGRAEPGDPSPEVTALREAAEEIGLKAGQVELIGRLPEYLTRTGYRVTPVVGLLTPPLELLTDAREVDEVFEVPLDFILDPRNHQRGAREINGRTAHFYFIEHGGRTIWGATAGMLINLYRILV